MHNICSWHNCFAFSALLSIILWFNTLTCQKDFEVHTLLPPSRHRATLKKPKTSNYSFDSTSGKERKVILDTSKVALERQNVIIAVGIYPRTIECINLLLQNVWRNGQKLSWTQFYQLKRKRVLESVLTNWEGYHPLHQKSTNLSTFLLTEGSSYNTNVCNFKEITQNFLNGHRYC